MTPTDQTPTLAAQIEALAAMMARVDRANAALSALHVKYPEPAEEGEPDRGFRAASYECDVARALLSHVAVDALPAIVAAIRQGEGAEAETYRYMHEIATETLGYPSILEALEAAPHADAPDERDKWPAGAKFHMGDLTQKKQRSKWRGPVVGFYSTTQTPIGYVVESQYETGSVQAWPEAALIAWDGAPDERDDEVRKLRGALGLALGYLFQNEPGDSRAVSGEFVAMAAVHAGCANAECLQIIADASAALSPAKGGEA